MLFYMRSELARAARVNQFQAEHTGERAQFWDDYADSPKRWQRLRSYYRQPLIDIYKFLIPPGKELSRLAAAGRPSGRLQPARGLGIDISER